MCRPITIQRGRPEMAAAGLDDVQPLNRVDIATVPFERRSTYHSVGCLLVLSRRRQLRSMCRTKRRAFSIAFGKRVREPHNAVTITAVAETIRVTQFVNRLRCCALEEQCVRVLAGTAWSQTGEREDGDAAAHVGFAENEVQVRNVQVDVSDPKHALPIASFRQGQRVEYLRGVILPSVRVVRGGHEPDTGREDNLCIQAGGEDGPDFGDRFRWGVSDRSEGNEWLVDHEGRDYRLRILEAVRTTCQ